MAKPAWPAKPPPAAENNPMKDSVSYNGDKVDGAMGPAANPSLAQKNMAQLMAMNASRAAAGMTATQGPHNKPANQGPFIDKSPAPRSG